MKHLLSLIAIIMAINTYGQNNELKGKTFQFQNEELKQFSPQFNKNNKKVWIPRKGKIVVLKYNASNDSVYYKYLKYTNEESEEAKTLNDNTFTMKLDLFRGLSHRIYSRYKGATSGAYTVPFRLRDIGGKDFDFESSLALQYNVIFGFGGIKSKISTFDLSAGIGVSSVNLNPNNSEVTEDRTASALTISGGFVFWPAKMVNIGAFLGLDFLGANDQSINWKHNDKLWLGLGINVSFNKAKTEKALNSSNQKWF